jgi:hypothetical protein
MNKQTEVLKNCLLEANRKKAVALSMAATYKKRAIASENKHHHLLGRLSLAIKEIQEIRDFAAQCHEQDSAPDTTELFEDLQNIIDNLQIKPHKVFYKFKDNKLLHMNGLHDKAWTVIVWD